jgi:hypothetical protein
MGPIVGIAPALDVVFKTPKIVKHTKKSKQASVKQQKNKLIKRVSWKNPTTQKIISDKLFLNKMRTALERDIANH